MAAALLAGKQWDGDGVPLADSNCAGIGSAEDNAARKSAAQTEPAWEVAGKKVGVEVWRIEKFKVVPWPSTEYGQFFEGDSYIVLQTVKDDDSSKLLYNIFFWLGEKTTTDEMGTAAYKTVELDDLFDGEPTQNREVMNYESTEFQALFPHITYLKGGIQTGFNHVTEHTYQTRLMQVRKTQRAGMVVKEVTCTRNSLNEGDCFVLDKGKTIYVWVGSEAHPTEKLAATTAAENIENQRHGKAKVTHDIDDAFWAEIGGKGAVKAAQAGTDRIPEPEADAGVLYKLSDAQGDLTTTEVGRRILHRGMLDSMSVMMLDHGSEICIWVGKSANPGESRNALNSAMKYLRTTGMPTHTPIHVYKEGQKIRNPVWTKSFRRKPLLSCQTASAAVCSCFALFSWRARGGGESAAPLKATAESDAAAGTLSLAVLQNPEAVRAKGVDPQKREQHLSKKEFQQVFGCSKVEFAKKPAWKQDEEKKQHGLY